MKDAPRLAHLRVLLAEDDAVSQLATRKQLELRGCRVQAVGDGKQVLEALRKEPL